METICFFIPCKYLPKITLNISTFTFETDLLIRFSLFCHYITIGNITFQCYFLKFSITHNLSMYINTLINCDLSTVIKRALIPPTERPVPKLRVGWKMAGYYTLRHIFLCSCYWFQKSIWNFRIHDSSKSLEKCGIRGPISKWFHCYLKNRTLITSTYMWTD